MNIILDNPDALGKNSLIELPKDKLKNFNLIGKAIGVDIYQCLFLAGKHTEKFWDRVYGYHIVDNDKDANVFTESGQPSIAVQFYEQKVIEEIKEDEIPIVWYLYVGEQIDGKLSDKVKEKINNYVKNHPDADMWEI